jgi:hypothetical protein
VAQIGGYGKCSIHNLVGLAGQVRKMVCYENNGLALLFRQQIPKDVLLCRGVESRTGLIDEHKTNFSSVESHEHL